MLTDNISVFDRLIKGSTGTANHFDMRSKPLCGTKHIKSNDSKVGCSLKDRRLSGELKQSVFITARKRFILRKGKSTVTAERKHFCQYLVI